MGLETGTFINDLNIANPLDTDQRSTAAGHLRLAKTTVKNTFPNITGAVNPTHTELNYAVGVTSLIQTQFTAKAATVSPTFTGTPIAPTAALGTSTTQIATTAFAQTMQSPAFTGTPTAPLAAAATNTTQLATTSFVQQELTNARGRWLLIQSQTASASATIDFASSIGSTYDAYEVEIIDVLPTTDAVNLWLRTSTNTGSTYDAGASDYRYVAHATDEGGGSNVNGGAAAQIVLTGTSFTVPSGAGTSGICGTMRFYLPTAAAHRRVFFDGGGPFGAANEVVYRTSGRRAAAAKVDAIRFMFSTGTIASGTFNLYGRKK